MGSTENVTALTMVSMYACFNPVSTFGLAHRRYGDVTFGVKLRDRLQHMLITGQTGAGKSTLLHNLIVQDARSGVGVCLVEPHGDLAAMLARRLGVNHLYWDVADPSSPYGYNPLTFAAAHLRPLIASGLIETLKKQWADAWGPRMEHLLRYAILALLETRGADLSDIMRLYLDKGFRWRVVDKVADEQVRQFWKDEYPKMNYKNAADGVAPIANKLGAFLANPVVRRALCAPETPLRFRRLMDEGGVLIVNLAKGKIGADTANVLGGLIVSSVMHAGFSRHDTPEEDRRPFFLYVDEFHNFSTTAIAGLLSEARKYALGVCLANQYTAQAERAVFDAIIGNVGSLIAFRLGVSDARVFAQQFVDLAPNDLATLPNYRFYAQVMREGSRTKTFSGATFPALS